VARERSVWEIRRNESYDPGNRSVQACIAGRTSRLWHLAADRIASSKVSLCEAVDPDSLLLPSWHAPPLLPPPAPFEFHLAVRRIRLALSMLPMLSSESPSVCLHLRFTHGNPAISRYWAKRIPFPVFGYGSNMCIVGVLPCLLFIKQWCLICCIMWTSFFTYFVWSLCGHDVLVISLHVCYGWIDNMYA
jgi:hypothetical protein